MRLQKTSAVLEKHQRLQSIPETHIHTYECAYKQTIYENNLIELLPYKICDSERPSLLYTAVGKWIHLFKSHSKDFVQKIYI